DASLVSSDVCTSGIGVYCRYLSASRSGRLVSERREAFGLNMPTLIDTLAGRRVDEHRRCPRIVVNEEQWRPLRATSSPTFGSAISRSTAPIPATTSDAAISPLSFRGSAESREPGIHNSRPGSMDSGLAAARRPE